MAKPVISLNDVRDSYSVFEEDQVLTYEQLNSVSDYLDDQVRLTRARLLGVGIACGLWASAGGNFVRLGAGVGVTTDGDLMRQDRIADFDRFKPYEEPAPKYAPFYPEGGAMMPVFELVRRGQADERAVPLHRLQADHGRDFEDMAAVLHMASYVKDDDLCTGTDCDNRGQDSVHAMKLLLVDAASADRFRERLPTAEDTARRLRPLIPPRPVFPPVINSAADLEAMYEGPCGELNASLREALEDLYSICAAFLSDLPDPTADWLNGLEAIRLDIERAGRFRIQYYYDFLKDLAATYNDFCGLVRGSAVCCPPVNEFPKHLLLGGLTPAARAAIPRTGFYPSPVVAEFGEPIRHARFLFQKLQVLIQSFKLPAAGGRVPVRITPSRFEDRSLEERAIPYYYDSAAPIQRLWSYELHRRGTERFSYSYHAVDFDPPGEVTDPLSRDLGPFDFFRIEGHLGWRGAELRRALEDQIQRSNLPIALKFLALDKPSITVKPPFRPTLLHELHYLLRRDLAGQLSQASEFGKQLAFNVGVAVDENVITDEGDDGRAVKKAASEHSQSVEKHASAAIGKLGLQYTDYDPASSADVLKSLEEAAGMRANLGHVSKTHFSSPLDQLIAAPHRRWVPLLDDLIKDRDERENDALLLQNYRRQHPGMQHYGGVLRGGTFVVVCDFNGEAIGDFMLPYDCCEPRGADQPVRPPTLLPPADIDTNLKAKAIGLVRLVDKFRVDTAVSRNLSRFKEEIQPLWQKDVADKTGQFFNVFKESINVVSNVFTGAGKGAAGTKGVLTDSVLDMHFNDTRWKTEKVDRIRDELLDPVLDPQKRVVLEKELKTAEAELAGSILAATEYVATANVDVARGTEGATVMSAASTSLSKVNDLDALTQVEKGLTTVGARTATKPEMKTVISTMLAGRIR